MWLSVKEVQATDDHKLILAFENAEKRCLDVRLFFRFGRLADLEDIREFRKVHVAFETIEWENGLDLDPEFLYERSVNMN